jgi:hypothetical protein
VSFGGSEGIFRKLFINSQLRGKKFQNVSVFFPPNLRKGVKYKKTKELSSEFTIFYPPTILRNLRSFPQGGPSASILLELFKISFLLELKEKKNPPNRLRHTGSTLAQPRDNWRAARAFWRLQAGEARDCQPGLSLSATSNAAKPPGGSF